MISFLLVLFLINLTSSFKYRNQESCDCHNLIKGNFNNTDVKEDKFRYLSSIFVKFNSTKRASICTTIIINESWSITNSDCCQIIYNLKEQNYSDLQFYVGAGLNHNLETIYENDLNYKEINQTILNPETVNLCLIETNQPFQLDSNTNIYQTCLQNIEINKFTNDFLFSGYKIDDNEIKKSELDKLLENKNSRLKLTNLKSTNCNDIDKKCIIDSNLCNYQNGGAIYYVYNGRQYLIGITSQTISKCNNKMEFELIYPNLNWIKMNTKNICLINSNKLVKHKKIKKSELLRKILIAFGILVAISFILINGFFAFKFLD